ncbi:MAG TPA: hypothetical protein PKG54_07830 [Phycisphaerae bacterium]|nr:hypothetical protein [Phycisphaerae bacterium]HOB74420.1 hypothetical protein [Phycisphaerae bacterium]HOJ54461.1 hypothetical protein [Phycisphaerae bacterium]HOL26490.1 hypothetical protein [Phycisphaerae bacterium]HPP20889.1 hypothetical protein [Phycisphaerae bacterium]
MSRTAVCAVGVCLLFGVAADRAAGLEVIGAVSRADTPFPQFTHLWSEGWALESKDGDPLQSTRVDLPPGAYLHVYLRNASAGRVEVNDVLLEGVNLSKAIAFSHQAKVSGMWPASLHFSKLPKDQIDRLIEAGEPVWWKAEPWTVPAGGATEVVVRLRRLPRPAALQVEVVAGEERASVRVPCGGPAAPRVEGLSLSASLDEVVLYARHPKRETRPMGMRMDGRDLMSRSRIAFDPELGVVVVSARLESMLARGSFHLFEVAYADGSVARAGQRAFSGEFVYGMWGYINKGATEQERVDYFLNDMRLHNVNALMYSISSEVWKWLETPEGLEYRRQTGLNLMMSHPDKTLRDPLYVFLTDEPDAHDFEVTQLDLGLRLGALAQPLVQRSRDWREEVQDVPQLLNVDNTFKPANWYVYAQLPDIYCADPYYQEQQRIAWNQRPAWAASFVKPTYVFGVATICQSACAPKPLHIILNSVRHDIPGSPFRFATPAEKRMEVFYALAGGAKALSYWWYTPYGEFHGCGSSDPDGVALWREIGLLGALTRTAGPLITRSCPAAVTVKAPSHLWVRSLLAGDDSLLLLVVNEGIASDRQGTVVVPVEKAALAVTPPAWLKVATAFEISEQGIGDLAWRQDGQQVTLDMGRLEVARMFVLTADSKLRETLSRRYAEQFAQTVARLKP